MVDQHHIYDTSFNGIENLIMSPNNVAKIGDTQIDMLEGINANCGLVIGVLSGHEKKDNLLSAGVDIAM